MDDVTSFEVVLRPLHHLVDTFRAQRPHPLSLVNFGGGLGNIFCDGQQMPSRDAFVRTLAPHLRDDFVPVSGLTPFHRLVCAHRCFILAKAGPGVI